MKLAGREAAAYFARPDPARTGALIYGADAMRVALRRQDLIAALIGPRGDEEMRLTRIPAADLRKDPAALVDAIKAQGFFPGARVAFVEDAADGLADTISAALADWRPGDAQVIVTAGALAAKSRLRKVFESHPHAYAIGIYDDPPSRAEIEATLSAAGITAIAPEAMADLDALARMLSPGDFRQTVEKLALFKHGDTTPASPADIIACAPATTEAALDDLLNAVAEGQQKDIAPLMVRLGAQGTQPVGLCIAATRHFRTLHSAASHPGGVSAGIAAMRPPVFGPRRDRMTRQAQNWGMRRLESVLEMLTDTDLQLRSAGQTAPAMALVERMLIRITMLAARR